MSVEDLYEETRMRLLLEILDNLPSNCVLGIGGGYLEDAFKEIDVANNLLKFQIESYFFDGGISPDYYFELNEECMICLKDIFQKNSGFINFFCHYMIYDISVKDPYLVVFDDCIFGIHPEIRSKLKIDLDICKEVGLHIQDLP